MALALAVLLALPTPPFARAQTTTKPTVTLSGPSQVSEGRTVTLTATLSSPVSSDTVVPLEIFAGTAEDGDYTPVSSVEISGANFIFFIRTAQDTAARGVHAAAIDALYAAGITTGCATEPLRYCPDQPVTRAPMATFLTRALELG